VPDTDTEGEGEGPHPAVLRQVFLAAREAGFLGPGPVERHLAHADGFVTLARARSGLGSGAGLPGLVIATHWPESTVVLLEANQRRAQFLDRAVVTCGLAGRVEVVHQRAEVCGRNPSYRGTFDGVAVRSFGAPSVVAECAAPFLRKGGWLIVSEPPEDSGGDPVAAVPDSAEGQGEGQGQGDGPGGGGQGRWPADQLAQLGLEPVEFVRDGFGYQVLRQADLCPDPFPRRNGVPSKKPLF
jgi:16S rRNA (guanine527-N7)-methyltransferase